MLTVVHPAGVVSQPIRGVAHSQWVLKGAGESLLKRGNTDWCVHKNNQIRTCLLGCLNTERKKIGRPFGMGIHPDEILRSGRGFCSRPVAAGGLKLFRVIYQPDKWVLLRNFGDFLAGVVGTSSIGHDDTDLS